MTAGLVRSHHHDGVTTLTLDRPDKANSISSELAADLLAAIEASTSSATRVLVITGCAGAPFCAGADIDVLQSLDEQGAEPFIRSIHRACRAVREHSAPVIAAVSGAALGAGLELMMSCDLAIATESTVLGMPEPHVGLPSVIEAALMPSIVGLARTRELLLVGDNISATEAMSIGLLNQVVADDELERATRGKCELLLRHDPIALSLQKGLIRDWLNLSMDDAIEAGVAAFSKAVASGAPKRAIESYWRRRKKA